MLGIATSCARKQPLCSSLEEAKCKREFDRQVDSLQRSMVRLELSTTTHKHGKLESEGGQIKAPNRTLIERAHYLGQRRSAMETAAKLTDTELLESIVFNAVARAKQENYEIEILEDAERDAGIPQPPRPRIPISVHLNGPRTKEFVYNSRGRRIHIRTDWTSAYEVLGLPPQPAHQQFCTSSKGVVLLVHGLNGHANRPTWGFLAHRLQLAGYHPVGFDFQGHGYSDRFCPGSQNPYYDYTRALINDYTELVDDMMWILSKLFVPQEEMRARAHEQEAGNKQQHGALDAACADRLLVSEYYQTPGGRKRKGRADSITKSELEEQDDLVLDCFLIHRFALGTPLFVAGTSMGGACSLMMSSILAKFKKAHDLAEQLGDPDALFRDMNALSLEDPTRRVVPVQPSAPSAGLHTDSGSGSASSIERHTGSYIGWVGLGDDEEDEDVTAFDNDEEDSASLRKMLVDPFVNVYKFLAAEFSDRPGPMAPITRRVSSEVQGRVKALSNKVQDQVQAVTSRVSTVTAQVQDKVLAVKIQVDSRVQAVKATVESKVRAVKSEVGSKVYAVKSQIKGKLRDVFQGKVGVHGLGSNMPGKDGGFDTDAEEPDWLDNMIGYLDSRSEPVVPSSTFAAGEDRGSTILYNNHEYPRQMMLHMGQLAGQGFAGAVLISPACAVDTPHPALVTFMKHVAVPLMPTLVVPQFLRRSDDSTSWNSVSFKSYNKTDGYPSGLSWGENVKLRTAYTILNLMQAVTDEIPYMDFPYIVLHDPLDRVTAFTGVKHLMEAAGSALGGEHMAESEADYVKCPALKGRDPLYALRRNRMGRLVVVPDGKHDIASNKTDLLTAEVVGFLNEAVAKREREGGKGRSSSFCSINTAGSASPARAVSSASSAAPHSFSSPPSPAAPASPPASASLATSAATAKLSPLPAPKRQRR